MESNNIEILDQVNVTSSNSSIEQPVSSGSIQQSNDTNPGTFDFLTKYLTKKNIYIFCGVIIVAGLIYYFYLKRKSDKKIEKQNRDINIELPTNSGTNDFYIPLPENTTKTMSNDEYNSLLQQQLIMQQQLQQQQQPQQFQQQQLQQLQQQQQQTQSNQDFNLTQIVHPGQEIQSQETDDIETPVLDTQNLTAEEIKQISEQLEKLQSEA
jgi:hypothetical protein